MLRFSQPCWILERCNNSFYLQVALEAVNSLLLPIPLILYPPKGIAASKMSKQLSHTVPVLNPRVSMLAVSMFDVKTPEARP